MKHLGIYIHVHQVKAGKKTTEEARLYHQIHTQVEQEKSTSSDAKVIWPGTCTHKTVFHNITNGNIAKMLGIFTTQCKFYA